MVSIPACHAGDRGSIPRLGDFFMILISFTMMVVIRYIYFIYLFKTVMEYVPTDELIVKLNH